MAIVARHLAGAVAAWLVVVVEGVVAYLGLLVYAVATNSNPGGPLAGPLLAVLAGVVGLVTVPLLFIPAVVAAVEEERRVVKVNHGYVRRLAPTAQQAAALDIQGHAARAMWNLLHEWWTWGGGRDRRPTLKQA
ncbi:hypothetical protein ACGFIZ_33160, partial [Micromonospora sp. NPDC048830]